MSQIPNQPQGGFPHAQKQALPPVRACRRKSRSSSLLAEAALGCANAVLKAMVGLSRTLSEDRLFGFARTFGRLERGRWKQRCIENMKLFLGSEDRSELQWEQLWNAHTLHLGQTMVEFLAWQRSSPDEVMRRVSVLGEEHLREALRGGHGATVLTNHLGNFVSVAPGLCQLGLNGCTSGNALPTPYLEKLLRELLSRFGIHRQLLGRGVPSAAAGTFRRGALFLTFVDLSLAGTRDEWFRFGQAETNVSIGPALLALRNRVPILGVTCRRLDARHHEATFHPPLPIVESGDRRADARQLTAQALEVVAKGIRQHPEQWWQWDWAPLRHPSNDHAQLAYEIH